MILVTGATGILGRVIVLELLKRGKTVRAAKRKSSNLEEVKKSFGFYTENPDEFFNKIEWINVDFEDIYSLQKALVGVEEVYHCAAKVSFHPKDKRKMYQTNINGTKQLLYASENSSVKKFLFVSSIAVLDGFNENGELDESSDFNPKVDHSSYAISKHFSEMEVWRSSAEGLKVAIVNPGLIIGSGNWNESSGTLFKELGENAFTFSGGTSYVDVRDVAKISVELMENNIFGERFILISENKKYEAIANFIKQKLGKPATKIVPNGLLKVGVFLNSILGWLISPLKMANKVNVQSVTEFNKISNKKIKEKLNYEFISVEESLAFHLENYLKRKEVGS
ncbi:NAD-dependent epimerase [Cloacibacterium rupense]|uniref:NAD-dependent epimerase n=1 Tax=Cloacibacterium rupense TaxID=517423 RepID=A0ABQ2NL88_9FLAO|nr:NAD-dependent epimerase/dehydratase family protein [Cloacibacterium rupense]GGP06134.1 NAD-dependent epimerase [Cloacibacterium rupense]